MCRVGATVKVGTWGALSVIAVQGSAVIIHHIAYEQGRDAASWSVPAHDFTHDSRCADGSEATLCSALLYVYYT